VAAAAAAKAEAADVGPAAKSSRLVGHCPDALGRTAQASRQSWDSAARVAAPAAEGAEGEGLDLEDMVGSAAEGSEVEAVAVAQAVVRAMWAAVRRKPGIPRTTGWRTPSGRRSRAPFCTEGCTRPWDVSRPADPSLTSGTSRRRGSARCTGRHWRAGTVCPCRRRIRSSILRLECAYTSRCFGVRIQAKPAMTLGPSFLTHALPPPCSQPGLGGGEIQGPTLSPVPRGALKTRTRRVHRSRPHRSVRRDPAAF
jgi:hypothetical protein